MKTYQIRMREGDHMEINHTIPDYAIIKELGQRLQQIRVAKGMTQKMLSENAGVSLSTITRFESGKSIQIDSLISLMRTLDILSDLNVFIPQQDIHPMEILREKNRKPRKRASAKRAEQENGSKWKWGDEK